MELIFKIEITRLDGDFSKEEKDTIEGCVNTCCSEIENSIRNRLISYNTEETA